MKVSVVTPNYNGERFLKTFLNSLNEDSQYIGEVIIVDNGSTDGSLDYLKSNSFDFPLVLIENKENVGFSPAVNQGIRKAKTKKERMLKDSTLKIILYSQSTMTLKLKKDQSNL